MSNDLSVVDLIYVGPKPPDLYAQLGLGKRLREADEVLVYELEFDREAAIDAASDAGPRSPVNG